MKCIQDNDALWRQRSICGSSGNDEFCRQRSICVREYLATLIPLFS